MQALKSTWFHILAALAERDLHGSGIVRDVLAQTDGDVRLWPATLYGSLEELTDEGLIVELTGAAHPEGVSGRRRYYRIAPEGRTVLREEAARLALMADMVLQRLGEA